MGLLGGNGVIFNFDFNFDENAIIAEIDRRGKEVIKGAAKEWLKAAIVRVPVYTGQAVASLQPIGRFVGMSIGAGTHTKKGYSASQGASQGHFDISTANYEYKFEVNTNVFYYLINEYYDVTKFIHLHTPGPWGSFAAGEAAAARYIEDNLIATIPNIVDYITFG